jgi:hypothetical protein
MNPTEILLEEHRLIERAITTLERAPAAEPGEM